MKKIKDKLVYFLLRVISFFSQFIPVFIGYKFAEILGAIAYKYLKIYQKIIAINLNIAFPEKSEKEKKQIAVKTMQVFCKVIFMGLKFPYLSKQQIINLIEFPTFDIIKNNSKNGAIFLSAHLGNYELLGAYVAVNGFPFGVVYSPIENKAIEKFVKITREKLGWILIPRNNLAKEKCKEILRQQKCLAVANDQNAAASGVILNFFNKPASTFKGFAELALEFNVPIIPAFSIIKGTKIFCFAEEPMKVPNSGDKKQDVIILTQEYLNILEKYIKQYPEQYFWLHKRWKGSIEYY